MPTAAGNDVDVVREALVLQVLAPPSSESGDQRDKGDSPSAAASRCKSLARYLHDQILEALPQAPVHSPRITPFGVAYEVVVPIDGLNGAAAPVVTTWIVERSAPPRLTTMWVDVP
jgi:hypothetical protein